MICPFKIGNAKLSQRFQFPRTLPSKNSISSNKPVVNLNFWWSRDAFILCVIKCQGRTHWQPEVLAYNNCDTHRVPNIRHPSIDTPVIRSNLRDTHNLPVGPCVQESVASSQEPSRGPLPPLIPIGSHHRLVCRLNHLLLQASLNRTTTSERGQSNLSISRVKGDRGDIEYAARAGHRSVLEL